MEWNQETVQTLSQCFLSTFSPNPEPRRKAESYLSESSEKPNYGLVILRLIVEPSTDEQIRHSAAVNFKNHLRIKWDPKTSTSPITDLEKEQIKGIIVTIMLQSTPKIQSQLSEALSVIGKHDFPKQWPALLPDLISAINTANTNNDYVSINGILGTANSIFKKFRYEYKTNDLFIDLKYCLDTFAAPLLEMFTRTSALTDSTAAAGGNAVVLKPLFESQRLCCRIFYSLNFQDLPAFFEDHMREWMTEFLKYLTSQYPALENTSDGMAIVDELRAAVCENINLYMDKYEEEFKVYLQDFAKAVWQLLIPISGSSNRDRLMITAIKFLTTISTSVHHTLFGGEFLKMICEGIVIPNVRICEEDLELFEMNYVEFIRRDMEGSDMDTRRRIACELLKGIATNYKSQVIAIVGSEIQKMMNGFVANPKKNWREKECAIYLVVALATKKAAGTSVSTDIVDVGSFFREVIVSELQTNVQGPEDEDEKKGSLMLKAGSLKFLTLFRNQIPKQDAIALMPEVAKFLLVDANVVHSYAASCIEKLLLVKEEGGRPRYTSSDIAPFVVKLMENLFTALRFEESQENPYIMRCILRVLGVAESSRQLALPSISGLTSILRDVCKNPKNPVFNHYLFEAVACLVRRGCEKDISLISDFEARIFPIINDILREEVTEFWPYAFQILAQLVELSRPPMDDNCMQVFKLLLSPDLWKKPANVPALVRLLQACLKKAPNELDQQDTLTKVLGIFQNLIMASNTEELGFYVLNTVIENLGYNVISTYVKQIWNVLFARATTTQTVRFKKSLVICMSLFSTKYGPAVLVESVNSVQPNLFVNVLENIWIPNLRHITGTIESKLASISSARLISESPVLLNPAAAPLWGKMLDSIVFLLSRPEQERVEEEPEVPDIAETVGYAATFVHLHNAGKKDEDPLREIRDPREYLVRSLVQLSSASPGIYPRIIQEYLDLTNQAALVQLCAAYNCSIV